MVLLVSVSSAKGEVQELYQSTLDPSNEFHSFLIPSNISKGSSPPLPSSTDPNNARSSSKAFVLYSQHAFLSVARYKPHTLLSIEKL